MAKSPFRSNVGKPIHLGLSALQVRLILIFVLFLSSAVLQAGFSIMHYKVFIQALENPMFEQELQRWGLGKENVRAVLAARGRDFIVLLRTGLAAVGLTLAGLDGIIGLLLLPVWVSLVAAIVAFSILGDWKAAVLYVGVLVEKCDLTRFVDLGLSDTGKDLTKRVANLPRELPFKMKPAEEEALQKQMIGAGVCLVAWFVARTLRGWLYPPEEEETEETPEEKTKSD